MSVHLIVNLVVCALFFIAEPLLEQAGKWANANSLGAEIVWGLFLPIILIGFLLFAVISLFRAIYLVRRSGFKALLPAAVLLLTAVIYLVTSTEASLWHRIVDFYLFYF